MRSLQVFVISLSILLLFGCSQKSETAVADYPVVALQMIANAEYCTLITIDSLGTPKGRLMDPLSPNKDFTAYLATNPKSAKVREINANPKVSLFYQMQGNIGYVSLHGEAKIVSDSSSKNSYWKESWTPFYKDRTTDLVLIEFKCTKVEMVNFEKGITSKRPDWSAPSFTP
jgi:general stress protein 26